MYRVSVEANMSKCNVSEDFSAPLGKWSTVLALIQKRMIYWRLRRRRWVMVVVVAVGGGAGEGGG